MAPSNIKVYEYWGVFQKCVVFICTLAFTQRGQNFGTRIWALIKSAHVPAQHPGHISNACSALLLEYEICMDHKEHMDHPSQYPLQRTIKKIIKPNTHSLARADTHVHTKWHINMHSHVVRNGLSVSVPAFCWRCACSKRQRHRRTLAHTHV